MSAERVTPKVGDRVRCDVNGVVHRMMHLGAWVELDDGGRDVNGGVSDVYVPLASLTVLPPPEPAYIAGQFYQQPNGRVWRRTFNGHWQDCHGSNHVVHHEHPARPLVRLVPVPEGQS